jgi:hypothetical protein
MRKVSMDQPPISLDAMSREWLSRLIVNINSCIDQIHDMDGLVEIPKNPQDGMVRYFKMPVDVITSIGFWGYSAGTWTKLN